MSSLKAPKVPIQSTAGAIPILNDKGEVTMEKVKVARYVTGKRPDYAPQSSDEEDEDLEMRIRQKRQTVSLNKVSTDSEHRHKAPVSSSGLHDAVMSSQAEEEEEEERHARLLRRRAVAEPEILDRSSESSSDEDEEEKVARRRRIQTMGQSEESEEEEELSEDEIERRRALLRKRVQAARQEDELMELEEEKEGSGESSSEYESEFESEEEDTGPRLRPIFVRKKDRVTIQEREKEERRQQELAQEANRVAEERRKQTLKIVSESVRKEVQEHTKGDDDLLHTVNTDDENDEEEYEAWKVRELKRMKRDKEEREQIEREKAEVERLRHMTEEERRDALKKNPKQVTNQSQKGKYKFLQKYYHRGAFFLDKEEDVLKRDYSSPTLEDHFDKTVLPKVMQVKNFGRSGRTKYTHLVDQDTTQMDNNAWTGDSAINLKFQNTRGGGMKQVFARPSNKKNK